MLRKLLFVSLAIVTLASCKKDKNDTPAYSVSTKVDGTKVDFNTAAASRLGNAVMITAVGGNASSPYPAFSIFIDGDVAAVTAKSYTALAGEAGVIYAASSGQSYESDDDLTVTVSSITATEIKGTFSGKVEDGATIKAITEGTFSAKFQ